METITLNCVDVKHAAALTLAEHLTRNHAAKTAPATPTAA
jgi:hypothetical protein